MSGTDEVYDSARSALLDALFALGPHKDAAILVGAQAVYLCVGEADIAVAPTTTDGDLALDPARLGDSPAIQDLMQAAGFTLRVREDGPLPGVWEKRLDTGLFVSVDLLTPRTTAGTEGRRAARFKGHQTGTVLKVTGIEGALVDNDIRMVTDKVSRSCAVRVAGPAALIVAKVHKIADRTNSQDRLRDKDALDVFRLLRGTELDDLSERMERILADSRSANIGRKGLVGLGDQFGSRTGEGIKMTIRATTSLMDEREVREAIVALTNDLLDRMKVE